MRRHFASPYFWMIARVALLAEGVTLPVLMDFVGYGEATDFEGSGAAPAIDAESADFRRDHGNSDTEDNWQDFDADEADPRNTDSPIGNRPPVPDDVFNTATNMAFVFSTTNGNAISVADPDAGSFELSIELSSGTFRVPGCRPSFPKL